MCIYTDRKPKAHKQISPAVAEALQSENLTLKKATVILFKALVEARNGGELPHIDGVDWDSEKVANGKSGRALNYIITQEARVDNRISNEEICSYDSDTQMLDGPRTCPDSPSTQASLSPNTATSTITILETPSWAYDDESVAPPSAKKRKSATFPYCHSNSSSVDMSGTTHIPTAASFIDPGLLQPSGSIGYPPTPPAAAIDYLSPAAQHDQAAASWPPHQQIHGASARFSNGALDSNSYGGSGNVPGRPSSSAGVNSHADILQWAEATQQPTADFYGFMPNTSCADDKDFRRFMAALSSAPNPMDIRLT